LTVGVERQHAAVHQNVGRADRRRETQVAAPELCRHVGPGRVGEEKCPRVGRVGEVDAHIGREFRGRGHADLATSLQGHEAADTLRHVERTEFVDRGIEVELDPKGRAEGVARETAAQRGAERLEEVADRCRRRCSQRRDDRVEPLLEPEQVGEFYVAEAGQRGREQVLRLHLLQEPDERRLQGGGDLFAGQ